MNKLSVVNVITVGVVVSLMLFCCSSAMAQRGGGGRGPQQSPEQMAKAATLEAGTVAQVLGLPADKTTKLTDAYKAARESHATAIRTVMKPGASTDPQVMQTVRQAEKAKFETAIKGLLSPEQTAKALESLGTFSRRWDPMVLALDSMGLEAKSKDAAMKRVMDYIVETSKAMQSAMASNDREAMREQNRKMKEALDTDMGKILSAEQMTKWTEATAMRRGGGERRGGPGNGPAAAAPETKPAAK